MNRNRVLAAGAALGFVFLAACSDSPTVSTAAAWVPKPSFLVGDVTSTPAPEAVTGRIVLCKTGNVGGSFAFTRTTEGPTIVGSSFVGIGPIDVASGTCLEVANDDSPIGSGSHITMTEAPSANTVQTIAACRFRGYQLDGVTLNPPEDCVYANGGDLFLNHFHGYVITYANVYAPPPPQTGCTYKKGWYQSKNATLSGVDGLTVPMEAAFFAAKPNQTGSVSFVGPNSLLNLYQQLLAALENGGASSGLTEVQSAIATAQAGTTVSGAGVLTTTLTNREIGNLINTLGAFNDGEITGWPPC